MAEPARQPDHNAADSEAAGRRAGFHSVQGGGEGGGKRANLHSVPTGPNAGLQGADGPSRPNLRLIQGGKSGGDDLDDRFNQLKSEADAAGAPSEPSLDQDAATARGMANDQYGKTAAGVSDARQQAKGFKKDAKEALKSAPNGNRPLTDEDRLKFSTHEERAAAGKANRLNRDKGLSSGASKIGTPLGTANYIRNHRSQLGIGGIVIVIMIAIGVGLGLLAPLKLESMMKNFMERRVTTRLERYMEKRGEKMFLRYLTAGGDGITEAKMVNFGEPIKDVFRTYKVNKFEARLEANQGVKFEKLGGGNIRVYKNGELVGDMAGRDAKITFNQAIKDETRWYQFIKRRHLRKWIRNAYDVRTWKWYSGAKGDDAEKEIKIGEIQAAGDLAERGVTDALDCATTGDNCLKDEGDAKDAERRGKLNDPVNANSTEADGSLTDSATNAEQDAASQVTSDIEKKPGAKLIDRILTKIFGEVMAKVITQAAIDSAGPLFVIGVIDFASRIDHFLYPGTADNIITQTHKVEYAAQFARWNSRADQIKEATLGAAPPVAQAAVDNTFQSGAPLSSDEFNVTMKYIEHTENSAAMQNILNGTHGGQAVDTTNDAYPSTSHNATDARQVDEFAHPIADFYHQTIGDMPAVGAVPFINPWCLKQTIHCELDGWYRTGRIVMDWINGIIGFLLQPVTWIIKQIINHFPPLHWLFEHIGEWLLKIMMFIIKSAVDGTEVGADLANGLDVGATVTGFDFARNLGARIVDALTLENLDQSIAAEQSQLDKKVSLWDRLFSPDYTHSFINNLALAAPVNLQSAVTDGTGYVASAVTSPFQFFGPLFSRFAVGGASADTLSEDNYHLKLWAYSNADLDKPIDDAALNKAQASADKRLGHKAKIGEINLGDCPDVDQTKEVNTCRLDIGTLQSASSRFTTEDDGGIDSPGAEPAN